jgi:hypothetical protein
MKKILQKLPLILLFTQTISYSQKCEDFNEGVFDGDFMGMKYVVERQGNLQLESMAEFEAVYLHKIEKISECENLVKRYKVIKQGKLSKPNMEESIKVTFYKIEDGKLFYKANLVGTDMTLEGYFIKKSKEISENFKRILANE